MLRIMGTIGLGILFVLISPALRETIVEEAQACQVAMANNSPGSYIALGVAILLGMMFALHRAAQPRI